MSKRDPKIELMESLPTFAGARRRELQAVGAAVDLVTVPAGEVLCRADRRAFEAFIVVDGMVDIVIHGTVVATLRRGQIVGEMGILDGQPRSADVVAATDVTLLVATPPHFTALLATSHGLRTAVLRQLTERVRRADEELVVLSASANH